MSDIYEADARERAPLEQGEGERDDFVEFIRSYPKPVSDSQLPYVRRAWDALPASERRVWRRKLEAEQWPQDQRYILSAEKYLIKWASSPINRQPPKGWQSDPFWMSVRKTALDCLGYKPETVDEYMLECWQAMEEMKTQNLSEGRRRTI